MSIGKVQMCLMMLGREKGMFSLDHSLHARLFQVLRTVFGERDWLMIMDRVLVTWTTFSAL